MLLPVTRSPRGENITFLHFSQECFWRGGIFQSFFAGAFLVSGKEMHFSFHVESSAWAKTLCYFPAIPRAKMCDSGLLLRHRHLLDVTTMFHIFPSTLVLLTLSLRGVVDPDSPLLKLEQTCSNALLRDSRMN